MSGKLKGFMYACSICGRVRQQRRDCRSCLNGHSKATRGLVDKPSPWPQALVELEEEAPPEDEGLAEDLATLGYTRPRWGG